MARVVSDYGAKRRGFWSRFIELEDVIGQALHAFGHGAIVDGIGADGIHFAAAAGGAEGNDGPEGVVEFLPLAGGDVIGDDRGIVG